jgi:hypothetical protein
VQSKVLAETVNVAEVTPAGTVTVLGTDATRNEPEVSATTAPPEGAGPERATVPVTVPPLTTEFADNVRLWICGPGKEITTPG